MDAPRPEPLFSADIPPGATAPDIRRKLYEREQRAAAPHWTPEQRATARASAEAAAPPRQRRPASAPPQQRTAPRSAAVAERSAARR